MPVLFLDIDGVLCTPRSTRLDWLLRRPIDRPSLDPLALHRLGRLVRRAGAQVVLSSSWRYGFDSEDPLVRRILQNLSSALTAHGAPLDGMAPVLGLSKGEEIAAWLADAPAGPYAILDDRADEFTAAPQLRPHLVLVDSRYGLRRRDCRQALALLGQNF